MLKSTILERGWSKRKVKHTEPIYFHMKNRRILKVIVFCLLWGTHAMCVDAADGKERGITLGQFLQRLAGSGKVVCCELPISQLSNKLDLSGSQVDEVVKQWVTTPDSLSQTLGEQGLSLRVSSNAIYVFKGQVEQTMMKQIKLNQHPSGSSFEKLMAQTAASFGLGYLAYSSHLRDEGKLNAAFEVKKTGTLWDNLPDMLHQVNANFFVLETAKETPSTGVGKLDVCLLRTDGS